MYLVIAYHGRGNGEVESDLQVLWQNLERLGMSRKLNHMFCFQAIRENVGADLLMVVEYEDSKPEVEPSRKVQPQIWNNRVDYWFYIRNERDIK